MKFELYDYQKEAIEFASTRREVYLGIPCGGGKTITALEIVRGWAETLIICPASLYHVWEDEIGKMYDMASVYIFKNKKPPPLDHYNFMIISYEKAAQEYYQDILKQITFGAVIVDEAHRLKNHKAKRTKKIVGWGNEKGFLARPGIQKVVLLSGTPMMQRPIELYAPARGLRPDLLEPHVLFEDFAMYYCQGYVDAWWNIIATGHNHMQELATKLKDFLFLVDKERVYSRLPPIQHFMVRLDVGEKIISQQDRLIRENLEKTTTPIVMSELAALSHKLSLEKIPLCVDYINNLIDNGDKVVVFAWHTDVIEEIEYRIGSAIKINGDTPLNSRSEICRIFRENTCVSALICQIKAVGEGFDLSCARHVVFVEYSWNPGDMEQCYKRVHRKGVEGTTSVHYLVASNSLDDYKLTNLMNKEEVVSEFNGMLQDTHHETTLSNGLGGINTNAREPQGFSLWVAR